MDKFEPVRTVADMKTLDFAQVSDGYLAALDGYVLKGTESRSFVHGWRNGMVDAGQVCPDEHQQALARDIIATKYDLFDRGGQDGNSD